jgi:hypothetical protein
MPEPAHYHIVRAHASDPYPWRILRTNEDGRTYEVARYRTREAARIRVTLLKQAHQMDE